MVLAHGQLGSDSEMKAHTPDDRSFARAEGPSQQAKAKKYLNHSHLDTFQDKAC
jgi:hypothetical protein